MPLCFHTFSCSGYVISRRFFVSCVFPSNMSKARPEPVSSSKGWPPGTHWDGIFNTLTEDEKVAFCIKMLRLDVKRARGKNFAISTVSQKMETAARRWLVFYETKTKLPSTDEMMMRDWALKTFEETKIEMAKDMDLPPKPTGPPDCVIDLPRSHPSDSFITRGLAGWVNPGCSKCGRGKPGYENYGHPCVICPKCHA